MGATWDYKTKPQTVGDTDFLSFRPLDLGWECVLTSALGQAQLRAWLGPSPRQAKSPVLMGLCVWVAFLPRDSGRELNSARQRHLWEDVFALLLLMQNGLRGMIPSFFENFSSFELTALSASRSQTLTRFFFFKCSDNLKIWWSQMIFKWILNGCQLFNF